MGEALFLALTAEEWYNTKQTSGERSGTIMKSYELTIETRQPTCGGKSPTNVELMEISLEDPMAFVRSREADLPLETENTPDGDLIIRVDKDKHQVTYTFTEL